MSRKQCLLLTAIASTLMTGALAQSHPYFAAAEQQRRYPTVVTEPNYEPSRKEVEEWYARNREAIRNEEPARPAYNAHAVLTKDSSPFYMYAQAGTQGIGVGSGLRLSPSWVVRAEVNLIDVYYNYRRTNNSFNNHAQLRTAGIYADIFPIESQFRITGGLMINRSKVSGEVDHKVNLNGTTYLLPDGSASFLARANSRVMPYLGIGYGHDDIDKPGLKFHMDLGAAIGKEPTVTLSVNNAPPSVTNDATFEADRDQEEKNLQRTFRSMRFYPVLGAGVGFTW